MSQRNAPTTLTLKLLSLSLPSDNDEKATKRGYLADEYDFAGIKRNRHYVLLKKYNTIQEYP